MALIYLFRHGQAGTRDDYDRLSPLGVEQARSLGEWLASEGISFSRVLAGSLNRQRDTAAEVQRAYQRAGASFPSIEQAREWTEFNLYGIYRELAPRLAGDDEKFRLEWEAMRQGMQQADAAVHREWTPCDEQVLRAWLESRYETEEESWPAFRARIHNAARGLCEADGREEHIAVFTSATPTGITVAHTLGLPDQEIMPLVAVLYNTAITTLRARGGRNYLVSFNAIPHLKPEFRTLR